MERVLYFLAVLPVRHYGSITIYDLNSPLLLAFLLAALVVVPIVDMFPQDILRSCPHCATTRATGRPVCGVSARAPKRSSTPT